MSISITFLGAADTVTGSRALISTPTVKILVDCGLFQGLRELRRRNWDPFPVDPSTIDAVVLTHAHLDHCGYLPLLAKRGFDGKIFATQYTVELAQVILRDSAHLQVEDAKYAAKKGYSKHVNPAPLYDLDDAEKSFRLFDVTPFHARTEIAPHCFVTFSPSGHILGSSTVLLEIEGKRFLFTGDLGRPGHPLLVDPELPPMERCDVIVTESTYGDRIHETPPEEFANEINAAIKRGGSILIPAFAVDRTEVILMALRELITAGTIPRIPIYVDSPMALTALNFYRAAVRDNSVEIRDGVSERWASQDPFDPGSLMQASTTEESKALNDISETSIIISASGMATGGRVVHHLEHMLPDPKNTVILVGYQAVGSRGRDLADGKPEIKMHGQLIPVSAHVAQVESFSVHADSDELIAWLRQAPAPGIAFVNHGESAGQESMQKRLASELQWSAEIPAPLKEFVLPESEK